MLKHDKSMINPYKSATLDPCFEAQESAARAPVARAAAGQEPTALQLGGGGGGKSAPEAYRRARRRGAESRDLASKLFENGLKYIENLMKIIEMDGKDDVHIYTFTRVS